MKNRILLAPDAASGSGASPFTAPKVGDTVNYIHPGHGKISKVKVVAVDEETEGRLITIELPVTTKNKDGDEVQSVRKVSAPYRPKTNPGGNTWHLVALLFLLSLFSAVAGIPTYHTFSAYGNASGTATVYLPPDPNCQIRVVTVGYTSDTNIGQLNFSSGTTAYSLLSTNLSTTATTNVIDSTNGLTGGTMVLLYHAGVIYTSSVSSFGNTFTNASVSGVPPVTNSVTTLGSAGTGPAGFAATNLNYVILGSGGWGVAASPGDEMYLAGSTTTYYLGAGTNILSGDDLFSGNYGRPVMAQINVCNTTNRLNNVSAHYDSASQP